MSFVMMFSAEALANYASSAVFTIINLLVTYWVIRKFLFKPAMKFMAKRQAAIENEIQS